MKVNVEKQPDQTSTLFIEVPPDEVSKEWDAIANSFARFAKIPGYRPGKAPRKVIEAKFKKEIEDELTKKLVSKSYHDAIEQSNLRVVSLTNLEDVKIGEDKSMRFRATVVTAPEFDLPEYKNIPVELPSAEVKKEDVDLALERLREQTADFVDVPERAAEMEDFVVIDFEGTVNGKPLSEVAPSASKTLQGGKKFWLRLAADNFAPKFCEQLVEQRKGETRNVIVDLAQDFMIEELRGKKISYSVTLNEIKQKVLPEVNDEFAAKLLPGKTLEELRHQMEHDLEHEKEHEIDRAKEAQVVKYLHEKTNFELPPPLLRNEMRRVLGELVQHNRERGITDEVLKTKEKELVEGSAGMAAHRLKTRFILSRIAEAEKIEVAKRDVDLAVRSEAARYDVSPEKMRRELEEHDGLNPLAEQILLGKVLDFLKSNVSVQTQSEAPVSEQK
ncbi:MAG: trigger factor [Verrucomicrobiota bacterium]|jgi:trigger factor